MAKEKKAEKAKPSKKPAAKKKNLTFKEKTEIKKKAGPRKEGLPIPIPQPEKNPGGRPSSFDEAAPKIIAYIRKGNTYECAAGCSRISYSTFASWIRQGKEDLENEEFDSKFLKFLKDVEQAEMEAEQEVLNCWKECIPGNWQAAKEFLARRNPDKWGSKDRVDLTSNGETVGKPIFLPLKKDAEAEEE